MAAQEWDWFQREELIGQISDIRVQNLQGNAPPPPRRGAPIGGSPEPREPLPTPTDRAPTRDGPSPVLSPSCHLLGALAEGGWGGGETPALKPGHCRPRAR